MALYNSNKNTVAIYYEAEFGEVPEDADAWVAAEGTDADRIYVLEFDPAFIRGDAMLANADLQPGVFKVGDHHRGMPTADGGALKMRLVGSEETWTTNTQVAETAQGRMLEHALGGGARGHHTTISAAASATSLTLAHSTNIEPGYIIAIEDADDPGRWWPVQVLTVSGADITIDTTLPFTPAISDKVLGAEMAWPAEGPLTNPADADASSISLLLQKGPHCWMAGGGHLELTAIALERGTQPALSFAVNAARGYPQDAGAPTSPAWTGTIQGGSDTLAVGRDTRIFIQTQNTTTWTSLCIFSASFTPGVPVKPQDGVTEAHDGAPGRCWYMTEPAETVLEIVVGIEATHQTWWANDTTLTVRFYQVAPAGRGWAIQMHECKLLEPPEPMFEGSNRYKLRLQARESDNPDDPALEAKFVLARF
jgi:hypothetical protein